MIKNWNTKIPKNEISIKSTIKYDVTIKSTITKRTISRKYKKRNSKYLISFSLNEISTPVMVSLLDMLQLES